MRSLEDALKIIFYNERQNIETVFHYYKCCGKKTMNKDCKSDVLQSLKLAMIKVYKVDKAACLKHISAEEGAGLSYRSRTMLAENRQKQRVKSASRQVVTLWPT